MKAEKRLENLSLIRQGRLSVCAVTEEEFDTILEMGETKK
jgi:predicted RNA-binding protein with PUA-like domain